jgi:hypothetical protein
MKTGVQTVELCMRVLPYRGHHPDGSSRLPITVSEAETLILVKHRMSSGGYNHIVRTDALEHWHLLEL